MLLLLVILSIIGSGALLLRATVLVLDFLAARVERGGLAKSRRTFRIEGRAPEFIRCAIDWGITENRVMGGIKIRGVSG